jgi:ABC-type nickel/cobalt efflux system permease component RcnA
MIDLSTLLNPPQGLTLSMILGISFILGLFHGATPDEHTWPITFSYSVGSYSTRKGMKAGFMFSLGFTAQRAILTTLGFLGLAAIYKEFNLDGPVYIVVGAVMFIAGSYVLRGRYIHLPFDSLLHGKSHHTESAERIPLHEAHMQGVSLRMATMHGLIAGFGFGAYATIITFILAPQVPGLIYAPLPGLFFGLGTMVMQVIFGAVFASFARIKKLTESDLCFLGRYTAGRTLYYGGLLFSLVGIFIILVPTLDSLAIPTGIAIPNLDAVGVATALVLAVVGVIGIGSLVKGVGTLKSIDSGEYCKPGPSHKAAQMKE